MPEFWEHPITQKALQVIINAVAESYKPASGESGGYNKELLAMHKEYLQKQLDELCALRRDVAAGQANGPLYTPYSPTSSVSGNGEAASAASPAPPAQKPQEPQQQEETVYSKYAPEMEVSVGCLACARAHLAAVSGDLKEALRFAREDGVLHPEVQVRLTTAEEEIVSLERHDWTPEKIIASPPEHQELIRKYLPQIRQLRQDIMNHVHSPEDLERVAAVAGEINTKFRMDFLQMMASRPKETKPGGGEEQNAA